jgi:hypothetical protein
LLHLFVLENVPKAKHKKQQITIPTLPVGPVRVLKGVSVNGVDIYENCIQGLRPKQLINDNIVNMLMRYSMQCVLCLYIIKNKCYQTFHHIHNPLTDSTTTFSILLQGRDECQQHYGTGGLLCVCFF